MNKEIKKSGKLPLVIIVYSKKTIRKSIKLFNSAVKGQFRYLANDRCIDKLNTNHCKRS